ncbi:hypothetical protein AAFF_G00249370 [Aldrovandia affinis]|uniref:Uncharacterized protein n=1 Tax=Aldrovandia affinis TaxID=143900 RepID=A0AAD7RDM9_9TELE|nr:hypothetical protein AAFF_G00249370 [Aldrovandia affinis]
MGITVKMEDIEAMFDDLLGEMDLLTESLREEAAPPESPSSSQKEVNFSFGFSDFNESLNELEDDDLDALMADLAADPNLTEEKLATGKGVPFQSFTSPHLRSTTSLL